MLPAELSVFSVSGMVFEPLSQSLLLMLADVTGWASAVLFAVVFGIGSNVGAFPGRATSLQQNLCAVGHELAAGGCSVVHELQHVQPNVATAAGVMDQQPAWCLLCASVCSEGLLD